ncbi:MAG: hypothetical protein ACK5Q5_05990 [Planctomycetaceae bacterium]
MSPSPLKAPTADGGLLSRPAPSRVPASLTANGLVLEAAGKQSLQGRTLAQLRGWTRNVAWQQALDYTRDVLGIAIAERPSSGPWFVTGHQPALFHPGVWAKNFANCALANAREGVALNLIVDNDLLAAPGIVVPRGPRSSPRIESFRMLDPQPPRPWEEAIVDNARPFETFGERVAEAMHKDWGVSALVAETWTDAVETREQSPRLSDCLTALRARQERRWGLGSLELPLSRLEESDPFRWFTAHILAQLDQFQQVHNAALAVYRRHNRIRSHSHPVPELRRRHGWLEAPFWIWQVGESQRHPLYVRPQGKRVEIACDQKQVGKLRIASETDACCAVEDLAFLAGEGWRIRSRALTTTLFARLCLADLFVHGIGGAKYDEMTDVIIERFYGLTPPVFLTLTATQHLPLQPHAVQREDLLRLRRQLRNLDFNPDRVSSTPDLASFATQRDQLVRELDELRGGDHSAAEGRERRNRSRQVYRELKQLRADQQSAVDPIRQSLRDQLKTTEAALAANRILKSRDFAWCLFPEPTLHSLAQRIKTAFETNGQT